MALYCIVLYCALSSAQTDLWPSNQPERWQSWLQYHAALQPLQVRVGCVGVEGAWQISQPGLPSMVGPKRKLEGRLLGYNLGTPSLSSLLSLSSRGKEVKMGTQYTATGTGKLVLLSLCFSH